jgi:hypothetical protein
MSASVPALIELQVRLAHLRYRRLFEPTTVPIMRVKVLIITARASGVVAIGALLLAFTADLRASLPHDPFGGDSVLLYDGATDIATKWHTELARMAIDQEAVKACAEEALSDCSGVLKLIAIVEEARGYRGRALFGHINRAINLLLRPTPGAWLSPLDVLRLGTGDCKDYALAKYFALRQAGISPERLRLVIVHKSGAPRTTCWLRSMKVAAGLSLTTALWRSSPMSRHPWFICRSLCSTIPARGGTSYRRHS